MSEEPPSSPPGRVAVLGKRLVAAALGALLGVAVGAVLMLAVGLGDPGLLVFFGCVVAGAVAGFAWPAPFLTIGEILLHVFGAGD